MINADFITEIKAELGEFQVTKTAVRAFLVAQQTVLERSLKRDGVVNIPNVLRIRLVDTPPREERLGRNPVNGEVMVISPRPASKKLRASFLVGFKLDVGVVGSISDLKSLERRKAKEPLKAKKAAQERALSKLSVEELEALGLEELASKLPKKKREQAVVVLDPPPPPPQATPPRAGRFTPRPRTPNSEPQTLVERIIYVMGGDTIDFDTICTRLDVNNLAPQRRSSVSNTLSGRRDIFSSPKRWWYKVK